MMLERLFAALYRGIRPHRRLLIGAVLLLLAGGGWAMTGLQRSEDARIFLPDDDSRVARDFALLQQGPLARKLVVTVTAADPEAVGRLHAAGRELAAALNRDGLITIRNPLPPDPRQVYRLLLAEYPLLLEENEVAGLPERFPGEALGAALVEARENLLGPAGWGVKEALRSDPLGLHRPALARLRYLNLAAGAELRDGELVSADGRSLLLVGETDIPMTDAAGARRLLENFRQQASRLPAGIEAELFGGHRYTLANASAVQRDLAVILPAVTIGLLLLLVLLLRSISALPALLLPVVAVGLTIGLFSLLGITVSGITIGFAAVVLGMAVDYGVHVFYALRGDRIDPATAVGRVARPVVYGALTTIGAFAVLGGSALPLQRQLALFAGCGLSISVLLALVLLPQLLPARKPPMAVTRRQVPPGVATRRRTLVVTLWLVVLGLAVWPASRVRIDGDLNSLNLVSPELRQAEQRLQQTWGDLRGRALLFAEGADLQRALEVNDRLFNRLEGAFAPGEAASLAPLLPAARTQEARSHIWRGFWSGPEGEGLLAELQARQMEAGFSARAFEPFLAGLASAAEPLTEERLREAGFAGLLDEMLLDGETPIRVLSLAPDNDDLAIRLDLATLPGVHLVSPRQFSRELSAAIGSDLVRFVAFGALLVVTLLAILFRRPRTVLAALAPVVTGLCVMLGVMGGFGLSFNLFNVVAVVLVIGLTVDYGIFMVWRQSGGIDHATGRAVLVSGLTTLAGFGSLVLGQHPALFSIGLSVLLGVGAALPAAFWVVPALLGQGEPGTKRGG